MKLTSKYPNGHESDPKVSAWVYETDRKVSAWVYETDLKVSAWVYETDLKVSAWVWNWHQCIRMGIWNWPQNIRMGIKLTAMYPHGYKTDRNVSAWVWNWPQWIRMGMKLTAKYPNGYEIDQVSSCVSNWPQSIRMPRRLWHAQRALECARGQSAQSPPVRRGPGWAGVRAAPPSGSWACPPAGRPERSSAAQRPTYICRIRIRQKGKTKVVAAGWKEGIGSISCRASHLAPEWFEEEE